MRPSLPGLLGLLMALGGWGTAPRALAQCQTTPTGTKLIASDPSSDANLGSSAAISVGDTIITGAPSAIVPSGPHGEAYIYTFAGGFWTQQTRMSGPIVPASEFGAAVALLGSTAIIGEPGAGRAWVTNRSGTSWSAPAALPRTEMIAGDRFGASAAMGSLSTRNTAIIGAPGYSGGVTGGGAAFVLSISTQVAGGWVESGFLTASDRAASDAFGTSVAISGSTAVVGAPLNSNVGGTNAGAVYVFISNAFASGWTQQAKLAPSDPHAGDRFGTSVAIAGDTIVVGAPRVTVGGAFDGKVYVFTRSGTAWTQHTALLPVSSAAQLGTSVAISGDRIVAGGPGATTPGHTGAGYALLFARPAGSGIAGAWAYQNLFVPPDAAHNDGVGIAVAISGTRLAVGSNQADQGAANAGAAFAVDITVPCPADFDCSGTLAVADIFAFLTAWFAGDANADFDGLNGLQVADIFAFLSAWFAGC